MRIRHRLCAAVIFSVTVSVNISCDNASTNVLVSAAQPGPRETPPVPQQPVVPSVNSGNSNPQPQPVASVSPGDSGNTPTQNPSPTTEPECQLPAQPEKRTLDVQYQNLAQVSANLQSLDVYMPAVANPCQGVPVVIWVHGGAWMLGDKREVDDKVRLFNGLGYALVSVNYRLSPNLLNNETSTANRIKFPDHPNDVGASVAWVYQNIKSMGGNPQKLALLGHSAGAHLAALVAMNQSYIQKVAPNWQSQSLRCLGSYDTEAYNINAFMPTASGQQKLFYLNAFGNDENVLTSASPINFIQEYGMAVQLARRGDTDRNTQLDNFKSALEAKKNSVNVINAVSLSHEEVNRFIGGANDLIMTPAVRQFVRESCFP